jgi:hypothetical protein
MNLVGTELERKLLAKGQSVCSLCGQPKCKEESKKKDGRHENKGRPKVHTDRVKEVDNNNKVDLRIDESLTLPFFLTIFLTMYRTTFFSTQPQLAQVINHRLIYTYVSVPAGVTIPYIAH